MTKKPVKAVSLPKLIEISHPGPILAQSEGKLKTFSIDQGDVPSLRNILDIACAGVPKANLKIVSDKIRKQL